MSHAYREEWEEAFGHLIDGGGWRHRSRLWGEIHWAGLTPETVTVQAMAGRPGMGRWALDAIEALERFSSAETSLRLHADVPDSADDPLDG